MGLLSKEDQEAEDEMLADFLNDEALNSIVDHFGEAMDEIAEKTPTSELLVSVLGAQEEGSSQKADFICELMQKDELMYVGVFGDDWEKETKNKSYGPEQVAQILASSLFAKN